MVPKRQKTNEESPVIEPAYSLESFQPTAQGRGIQGKPSRFPEFSEKTELSIQGDQEARVCKVVPGWRKLHKETT